MSQSYLNLDGLPDKKIKNIIFLAVLLDAVPAMQSHLMNTWMVLPTQNALFLEEHETIMLSFLSQSYL